MSTLSPWTRRDPFAEFDQIVRRAFGPTARTSGFTPAAEIDRDGDDAVVRLELPGLDVAKDVVVEIERAHLIVRGERRDERAEAKDGRTLREVRYGGFRRSFALPAHVTSEAITAEYDAGILTIKVAGAYAGAAAKRIEIASTADTPALEAAE